MQFDPIKITNTVNYPFTDVSTKIALLKTKQSTKYEKTEQKVV